MSIGLKIKPADNVTYGEANVFLHDASAYYDKSAGAYQRVTLLPGSLLGKHDPDSWIYRDLEELVRRGYVERVANGYRVTRAIIGSTSGTAAAVLGRGFVPNGYVEWKFPGGRSIDDSGERPD